MSLPGQSDEPPKRLPRFLLAVLVASLLWAGTAFAATDTPNPGLPEASLDIESLINPSPPKASTVEVSKSTATLREEALEEAKRQEELAKNAQKLTESRRIASTSKKVLAGDREANRAIVKDVMLRFFDESQWPALDWLVMKESGYNNTAQNPRSTAYGMFQFLNATWKGPDINIEKTSDPEQQAIAGMRYIQKRYGTPEKAKQFHLENGWY